ncbi:MAG: NAD(P)H-hydrate dehydratase [Verrucomicrobia bacterium]|nr:NAD(P)H-hydrate dehydratase [Verrucomicrobiota bacterium]
MLEGKKVVSADEMRRIEALAYAQGHRDVEFMDKAGLGIAKQAQDYCERYDLDKHVIVLVGKGNNGGDALTAAVHLLSAGYFVEAFMAYPEDELSSLCREKYDLYKSACGQLTTEIKGSGIILDGLVGTGFKGKAEGPLAEAIAYANQSGLPILAVDIPSGLDATTGTIGSVAIEATQTLYLGLPKIGFFIQQGWDVVGELVEIDFDLPPHYIAEAKAEAHLIDESVLQMPKMRRSQHKYEAGYVLGIAGSAPTGGAAALASLAALRTGAGIVRLFHSHGMETASLPWEVLREPCEKKRIAEESARASSYFIGPGLGRTGGVGRFLKKFLPTLKHPAVLDADALYFLPKIRLPHVPTVLTPHHGEMKRLLGGEAVTLKNCQHYVEKHQTTLLLKGGPTIIFHPERAPLIMTRGNPGMATAGTGDVLTGIVAALLAQKVEPRTAAVLGATLHAAAGDSAACEKSAYGLIASDIITHLPEAITSIGL